MINERLERSHNAEVEGSSPSLSTISSSGCVRTYSEPARLHHVQARQVACSLQQATSDLTSGGTDMTKRTEAPTQTNKAASPTRAANDLALIFHGVRYQVGDVARSVEFYTRQLGFNLE